MGAEWRLDSLMSVVCLDGESSSTGEMKPSSSKWSRKPSMLRSGRTVTVNCVFESASSSEPSSSSCRRTIEGLVMRRVQVLDQSSGL